MKIIIPGGTGQLGNMITRQFLHDGHDVVILSRSRKPNLGRVVVWDPSRTKVDKNAAWVREFDGADVVLNLAGRSVNCRYHRRNRDEIMRSRIDAVHAVADAMNAVNEPPRVWLQASTATIYAHRYDAANDEEHGRLGGDEINAPETWNFSIDVAKAWEQAFDASRVEGIRKVKLRAAMIMSAQSGGTFRLLLRLVRLGLGGACGDGRQFMSWIHEIDFARAVDWLIEHEELSGAVNICAPEPLPQREFMRTLRRAWGQRIGLSATKWMLEVGTFLMRTESELILKSRRVVPQRLLDDGFEFRYPTWKVAAEELCRRVRKGTDQHRERTAVETT